MTERKKVNIIDLQNKKREGKKITMLTAYDYPMARIAWSLSVKGL